MEQKTPAQSFGELIRFALIALIVVIPIRLFVAEPFIVRGSSMVPTFQDKDYLIVDKISYELGSPKRDDVVIFRFLGNPNGGTVFYIKRIIGLPGETVDIKGNDVTITTESHSKTFKLEQPFVENPANNITHFELKEDEYFVMGDNRSASSDSRYWGAVKRSQMVGRAFLRLWPVGKIDLWPGYYFQSE